MPHRSRIHFEIQSSRVHLVRRPAKGIICHQSAETSRRILKAHTQHLVCRNSSQKIYHAFPKAQYQLPPFRGPSLAIKCANVPAVVNDVILHRMRNSLLTIPGQWASRHRLDGILAVC